MTEKPGIKIRSEKATIETLQVTIKSIRIDKKQMTLAVFRQLPIEEIIDGCSGDIRDDFSYWGVVRYNIKDEGKLWVIFSFDGCIYRSCIDERKSWRIRNDYEESIKLMELKNDYDKKYKQYLKDKKMFWKEYGIKYRNYIESKRIYDDKLKPALNKMKENGWIKPEYDFGNYNLYYKQKTLYENALKSFMDGLEKPVRPNRYPPKMPDPHHSIVRDDLYEFCHKAKENWFWLNKCNESLRSLYDLDQLFIAV